MPHPPDIEEEARYRREERLGILCGSDQPMPEQVKIAERDYWRTIGLWKQGTLKSVHANPQKL